MEKKCIHCNSKLEGRSDKKYCSSYCRSSFHYEKNKEKEAGLFFKIDKKLKNNRKILKEFNKAGLATVRKEKLLAKGFDPTYFTNYWKNNKGQVYLFCYEYGFLAQNEKYILIHWQSYMKI